MSPDPVVVPVSRTVDFTSTINARSYRLMIAPPLVPAPARGYPVLYVVDGHGYFGLATDAARNRGSIGREIAAPVVVGVGYADEDPVAWHRHRMRDLTPTQPGPQDRTPPHFTADDFGGLDAFLDVVEHEVKARVASLYAIDHSRAALFGHSLGGVAVLRALFRRPEAFRSFLCVSPAIWWNEGVVLRDEDAFLRRLAAGDVAPRVLLAAGAREEVPPDIVPPEWGMTREEVALELDRAGMVRNARALAERLQSATTSTASVVRFTVAPDETHITVPFAVFRHALDLAFPPGDEEGL